MSLVTDDKKNYVCSVLDLACECEPGRGCAGTIRGPRLDEVSEETLRLIKSARVLVVSAQDIIKESMSAIQFNRMFPNPELRQVLAKLKTALALIDEVK